MEENKMTGSSPFGLHLVHLDLKGAPPKVSYLAEILPLFRTLGANGLLIEYEDMFPYEGELKPLRAEHAYSASEIKEILNLAKLHELEVIPLVQTFGHMEFVLKHQEFSHLREVEMFPNALNPHKEESLMLVSAMIDQVVALHDGLRWFHIGSDEVYYLGEGEESKQWLQQEENSTEKLCLSHMKAVASCMVSSHPAVKPIVWDDMLRGVSEETLTGPGFLQYLNPSELVCSTVTWDQTYTFVHTGFPLTLVDILHVQRIQDRTFAGPFVPPTTCTESGVAQLLEPMIWDYAPDLDMDDKVLLIEKYRKSGFPKLWFASAFKGATGVNQSLTLIGHHIKNHLQWLKVANSIPADMLQGIALTGWQRYDHFSVLCELLPVGIPSLAVCLQTLQNGGYSEKVKEDMEKQLGLSSLEIDTFMSESSGTFPGSDILTLVTQICFYLKPSVDELLERNRYVTGWFSPYHRKRRIVHPIMIHHFQLDALSLLSKWNVTMQELQAALERVFYTCTVEEWMEENVHPSLHKLQEIVDDLDKAIQAQSYLLSQTAKHLI